MIAGNLFRPVLKGIQDIPKTKDITIRRSIIEFQPVELWDPDDEEVISISSRMVEIPPEVNILQLMLPAYKTIKEMSDISNIPEHTLRQWCREGRLEAIKNDQNQWWMQGTIKNARKVAGKWKYQYLTS